MEKLVAEVGEFRIRDRRLAAEQKKIEAILRERDPSSDEFRRYREAVERYFGAFAREARQRLDELDRRIAHVNQVQFNLQAERGVALRRIEKTQGVLSEVSELG
ncbi:MAG: hypothetical protein JO359_03990 [Candidatus Eremiobacteraeota bacterium]|nr:hypothetical protein [Candidatus Eremiobacteraeota bacterium]